MQTDAKANRVLAGSGSTTTVEPAEATIDEALQVCMERSEAAMLLVIAEAEAVEAHSIVESTATAEATAADSGAKGVEANAGAAVALDQAGAQALATLDRAAEAGNKQRLDVLGNTELESEAAAVAVEAPEANSAVATEDVLSEDVRFGERSGSYSTTIGRITSVTSDTVQALDTVQEAVRVAGIALSSYYPCSKSKPDCRMSKPDCRMQTDAETNRVLAGSTTTGEPVIAEAEAVEGLAHSIN